MANPQLKYPATVELAVKAAPRMGLNNPWNRGYPNNRKLQTIKSNDAKGTAKHLGKMRLGFKASVLYSQVGSG
jgi:hypothetical protein